MYVQTTAVLLETATAMLATGAPFHGAKIALYTNDIYPVRTLALSDFTITDFGGLTNLQAITWGAPFLNGNQQGEVLGGLVNWLTTSTTGLPVTAYGYVITDSTGAVLQLAERFATPITFNASGNSYGIIPRLVWDT